MTPQVRDVLRAQPRPRLWTRVALVALVVVIEVLGWAVLVGAFVYVTSC